MPKEIAFDVLHCTAGDLVIATIALGVALLIAGGGHWPLASRRRVAFLAIAIGLARAVFSEWFNGDIRGSRAYSNPIPIVPGIGDGVAPLGQWPVVSGLAIWQFSSRWRNVEPLKAAMFSAANLKRHHKNSFGSAAARGRASC